MVGRLIVFEGVEGSGKTTQIKRSQAWLQSLFSHASALPTQVSSPIVLVTREPGGTELGLKLRQLLLTEASEKPIQYQSELLLYAADRAQHVEEVLKPNLAKGAIILCDRYTDSTVAYQGYGRGLSLSLINQLNSIATGGLHADLTLWLDIDVEVSLARKRQLGVYDRIEQTDIAFHRRVQQGYTELAVSDPQRIVRIDASLSEAAVLAQIQAILSQRLKLENQE